MNLNQVLKKELERISVPEKEVKELRKLADDIVKKISSKTSKKINIKIGGSLAKGTLIRKDVQDIDIFVVFENEEQTHELEKILKKAKLDVRIVHGSRDYFRLSLLPVAPVGVPVEGRSTQRAKSKPHKKKEIQEKKKIVIEIVPVTKVSKPEEAENVTDVSLMHVGYVRKQIHKNPKLAGEIKLAKAFCHAQDCYGAESYIQGFSGYALEVLLCYFRSFLKFLKEISRKKIIDPERFYKNETEVMHELNESKLESPIILIDPTYKCRNVVAGLSGEVFEKFLKSAKEFLKSPSLRFFEKEEINAGEIRNLARKKKARFMELDLKTDRQEGDIAGTKMKKFFRFIVKELEKKQQKVLLKEFIYSGEGKEAKAYLIVKEQKEIEIRGPGIKMKEAVKGFKKARKNKTYVKKDYVYAKEKIDLKDIFAHIKQFEDEMGVQFIVEY